VVQPAIAKVLAYVTEAPRHFVFAITCMSMFGAVGKAFEMLDGYFFGRGACAAARNDAPSTAFLFNNSTRALRADAAFARLVGEIGLSHYWQAASRHPDFLRYG
jgi:hypothetical protein